MDFSDYFSFLEPELAALNQRWGEVSNKLKVRILVPFLRRRGFDFLVYRTADGYFDELKKNSKFIFSQL